jgi:Tol biopolymer transport system component
LLAFLGRTGSEEPWRIYLVDSDGGTPRLACAKNSDPVNDLSWTPDGKSIIYDARGSYYYPGVEQYLRVLNLATCEVSKFPGSEGLIRPRWSPDGSALAAVEDRGNPTRVMLYHVSSGKWEELVRAPSAIHPAWSHDGRSLWYCRFGSLVRCDIARNRNEEVARARPEEFTGLVGSFFGLTANDEPMMLRRRDVQQVYAFELKTH